MATVLDVENAIVAAIAPKSPYVGDVRYFPGMPFSLKLEELAKANKSAVSVFPYNVGQRVPMFMDVEPQKVSETETHAVMITEVARQKQWFQINVWANNPVRREAIAESIKLELDQTDFLVFADASKGRIRYVQFFEDDSGQEAFIYRRVLLYEVEYATIKTETVRKACLPVIDNVEGEEFDIDTENTVLVDEITDW